MTLIIWLLAMNIKTWVDAVIWGGADFATKTTGEGYCDVMIKLQAGANVGISSSTAAIMFNLYRILKADSVIPGLTSFKKIATDLAISLLTPILVMGLNYLTQFRRYYIFRYSGCQNVSVYSWVTIVTYTAWLIIWAFIGVIFAVLIIFIFFRKRKDVKDILKCTNSGLTLTRFAKLLIFCCVIILVMFPLSIYIFTNDIGNVSNSYSFKDTHNKAIWGIILFIPLDSPYYFTWIYIALAYIVFVFFGLGSDAIDMYISFLSKIGFAGVIEYFRRRQQQKKMLRADKMVNSAFGGVEQCEGLQGSPQSKGTSFDIEMQKMIAEEEGAEEYDKSPTSTTVSNIFADKHELPQSASQYRYLTGKELDLTNSMELDEDDIEYLNMLYEDDRRQEAKAAAARARAEALSKSNTLEAPSPTATTGSEEVGYKYTIQHRWFGI